MEYEENILIYVKKENQKIFIFIFTNETHTFRPKLFLVALLRFCSVAKII